MTKIIQKENEHLHQCEECGFRYEEKERAEKCEAWCKEHQSCNIEITAHAIPQEDDESELRGGKPPAVQIHLERRA